jgi:hypothetical protein
VLRRPVEPAEEICQLQREGRVTPRDYPYARRALA